MRPIKFRAWDKENKKWLHDFRIHPEGHVMAATGLLDDMNAGENLQFWLYEKSVKTMDNMELMQFTGLLDKNGKEIYEGDIFQSRNKNESDMQGEIYFEAGCFKMEYGYQKPTKNQRKDYFLSGSIGEDGAKEIEVIGNIYENPELLHQA